LDAQPAAAGGGGMGKQGGTFTGCFDLYKMNVADLGPLLLHIQGMPIKNNPLKKFHISAKLFEPNVKNLYMSI